MSFRSSAYLRTGGWRKKLSSLPASGNKKRKINFAPDYRVPYNSKAAAVENNIKQISAIRKRFHLIIKSKGQFGWRKTVSYRSLPPSKIWLPSAAAPVASPRVHIFYGFMKSRANSELKQWGKSGGEKDAKYEDVPGRDAKEKEKWRTRAEKKWGAEGNRNRRRGPANR